MIDAKLLKKKVFARREEIEALLDEAYRASRTDTDGFQAWFLRKLQDLGLKAEEFRVGYDEIVLQPAFRAAYPDEESAVNPPRNVVGTLNPGGKGGVLLFAHADKLPVTFDYASGHPEIDRSGGRYIAPGIADDVSGIASMLSAVMLYKECALASDLPILVASILGKQGGVFGTYGLMRRYGPAEAAIYVHPAESGFGLNELKIASNGLIEYRIDIKGKRPDSTEVHQAIFSLSAVNAAEKAMAVHSRLQSWAAGQSEKCHHPQVHQMAGQSFSVALGKIETLGETEIYEIPLLCRMQGTICFPPNAGLADVKKDFEAQVDAIVREDEWLARGNLELHYGDRIGESAQTEADDVFLLGASRVVEEMTGSAPSRFYGHSMSDIRYPLLDWDAPSFGIGPLAGDLGKETEWVDQNEYLLSIALLTALLIQVGETGEK